MNIQNLSTLKIHKLTQEQYDRELEAGTLKENELYLTPEKEIDLSPYATVKQLTTKADTIHNHNDIYYTETEVDSKLAEINTAINGKSDTSHTHDDRYYTEAEIDTKVDMLNQNISNKADSASAETKEDASAKLTEAKSYADTKTAPLASTASVNTSISEHNSSATAHSDIRSLIDGLTNRLNALADSDDATLDQLSEIVEYIKSNRTLIENVTTNKLNVSDVIDNLTTNVSNKALSAKQGVAIKTLIDALQSELDNHTHAISEVTGLQSALDGKAESSHGTHVLYSTTAPVMDGTASVGTASTVARSDHKHPTDTSRAAKADFDTHISNTTSHVTAAERTNWNSAKTHADTAHAPSNAEKNQNAFSYVKVGDASVAADTATDTLTLAGSNVTLTPDASNDKVTIGITKANVTSALGYTPPTTNTTYSEATTGKAGLMSATDKGKLDGIASGATKVTVDSALSSSSSNPVQNKVIQTALATKQATVTGGASTITSSNLTASRVLVSNSSGKVAVSDVTSTELGYLDGVTSNVQTQLNNKLGTSGGTVTGSVTFKQNPIVNKTIDGAEHSATFGVTSTGKTYINHKTDGTEDNWLTLTAEGSMVSKPWAVAAGGTGAKTAAEARVNLGAAPSGYGTGDVGTNINGTDLLDVLATGKSGLYRGKNIINGPGDSSEGWYFDILCDSTTYSIVHAYDYSHTKTAYGAYVNGTFKGWKFSSVVDLGSMGGKTISDLQNALDSWLDDCSAIPNSTAKFTTGSEWLSLWNGNDTTTQLSRGVVWTVTLIGIYITGSYARLRICSYLNGEDYTVIKQNGVWQRLVSYMEKTNPEGEGSLSMNRASGTTIGENSVALGENCSASGQASFALGENCSASGQASVALGFYASATGNYGSISMGWDTVSKGLASFSTGDSSTANGDASTANGYCTVANKYQHAVGKWNKDTTAPSGHASQDSTNSDAVFLVGYGTSSNARANAFRISSGGKCFGTTSFGASGADFAEYFEWADGNPNNEDRRGLFVSLDGEKIKIAHDGDDYIGIISGAQAFIGNSASEEWQGKYLTDVFGERLSREIEIPEVVDEDTGEIVSEATTAIQYILNPDYDPDKDYTMRENRKEWGVVGLLGQIIMIDDGTCVVGGHVKPSVNGIGTASDDGYRVMKRIDENHIKVLVK